jgi:hypothetical protein
MSSSKGKRVRFLDPETDTITPLDPLTPPATHVPLSTVFDSSLPSSSGPRTPQNSPTLVPDPSVHWALCFDSPLRFDAAHAPHFDSAHECGVQRYSPPASPTHATFRHDLEFLVDPATSPPLPFLVLTCEDLPWQIEVRPSLPNLFVTVYDVLKILNLNLRSRVSKPEWMAFGSEQDGILAAFEKRVNAICDEEEREEQRESLRRIDYLMGRTRLVGAYCDDPKQPDVLMINWDTPP